MVLQVGWVELGVAADHADVGIGRQAGGSNANAQIRREHAALAVSQRDAQEGDHVCADPGMLGRAAGRRPDPTFEELVPDDAVLFDAEIVVEREAMMSRSDHDSCKRSTQRNWIVR